MLLQPDFGLFFWTTISFLLLLFILRKYAWGPITEALKDREMSIEKALRSADQARLEMENLQADNTRILNEAKEERNEILKAAKSVKEEIINEAKEQAKKEASKIVEDSRREIENQKMAALTEVKNQIGTIALEVAEKILRKKMEDNKEQEKYIAELVDELKN